MSRRWLAAGLVTALALLPLLAPAAGAQSLPVKPQAVPGGVTVVSIRPLIPGEEPPIVRFGRHRVPVLERDGTWHAVVGLPLSLVPGQYIVTITPAGRPVWSQPFEVQPKRYPVVRPAAGESPRSSGPPLESAGLRSAIESWRDDVNGSLPLNWPVTGTVVTPFGLQRVYADGELETERALAIRPATGGTMVRSPADGVITAVLSRDEGDAVLLDHGHGLLSLVYPLRDVQVRPQERVVRGRPLGYPAAVAGAPRRGAGDAPGEQSPPATAAVTSVVHWAVCLNAAWVDPALLAGT